MDTSSLALGIALILAGFGATLLILFVLRWVSRRQARPVLPIVSLDRAKANGSSDAVLMVQLGGRVLYINPVAQEWFEHYETSPNLERLARLTHPSEAFLGLCASESQARFSLNGRIVEGASYLLPQGGSNGPEADQAHTRLGVMFVTLRHPQSAPLGTENVKVTDRILDIFADLSQEMAANLELDKTLLAILESVQRLIPSDFMEVTVKNPNDGRLVPYHLTGLQGIDQKLEDLAENRSSEQGFTGYLIRKGIPVLVTDIKELGDFSTHMDRARLQYASFLGAPLQVAGELVGTLEVASFTRQTFTANDLEIFKILSAQAAQALKNALLFQEEQKRVMELTGLARLAQAVGTLADARELFEWLVDGISPLLNVKTLGFLIYQESQRVLEARQPFVGIPVPMLALYHADIPPGSPAEEVFLSQQVIHALNAPGDASLQALGLQPMATAAGIRNSVLVPLVAAGQSLGYLQVADKKDSSIFNEDDFRILSIVASQSAAIIQNAHLLKESQERTLRSEALRRVASLTASVATLDEILSFSLLEIARLLKADVGMIFLLNENTGELAVHAGSLFGIPESLAPELTRIAVADPDFRADILVCHSPFIFDDIQQEEGIEQVYRSFSDLLKVNSLIGVPLAVRNQGVGEFLLGNRLANFFNRSDLTLVSTTSSQLSNALEKASLFEQTDESLQRRVEQLLALMRLSRELNTTMSPDRLARLVFDEALQATRADCGWIALFESDSAQGLPPRITFHAGDGEGASFSPLEQQVLEGCEPLLVKDYASLTKDAVGNPIEPPHVGVQSSLIVPIAFQSTLGGMIHLHARTTGQFDDTTVEVAQSLAVQAAIALGNAQKYQEQRVRSEALNRQVMTLAAFLETSQTIQADSISDRAIEAILRGIGQATPFSVAQLSRFEPGLSELVTQSSIGLSADEIHDLQGKREAWAKYQALMAPEYRLSNSYFVPGDHTLYKSPDQGSDDSGNESIPSLENSWHTDDLLFVPILGQKGDPLGLIRLDKPRDGKRPDRQTIEALELFTSQANLVVEAQYQVGQLSHQADELERKAVRSQSALHHAQATLPVLLHNDLSHTLSIQRLNQRLHWVNTGMDIIELVNIQTNRSDVLRVVGQELLAMLGVDIVMVAEPGEGGLRLLHALGKLPPGTTPQSLLGQRNPLRASLASGDYLLVSNLEENTEWNNSPLLVTLNARAFICFPILGKSSRSSVDGAGSAEAVVLAVSHTPIDYLSEEDEHIFSLLSGQIGDALDDLRLLEEMNRRLQEVNLLLEFSRQLGSLDTTSILKTMVDSALQAIPSAVAGMVALWSAQQGRLVPQYATGYNNNQKMMQIVYRSGEALPGQAFEQGQALRIDEVDFAQHYNLPSEFLLLYRDATEGRLPVSSLIIPLQTQDIQVGVLVLDNFKVAAAFSEADQALATSLARQTALTLENARLYQAARDRGAQLQALTHVAGTMTSSLQVNELVGSLLDQAYSVLPFDTGTLWLRLGDTMSVKAARGFENVKERIGLSVALEDSLLLREMITTSQPISVDDVRQDQRFSTLVENPYLSWLGIPLLSKGEVTGVIALEKAEPYYFTPEHIQAMVTFSGQAAVALENARLYEESVQRALELDERSSRLALLNRVSSKLSSSLDQAMILSIIVDELPRAITCDLVSVALFRVDRSAWVEGAGPRHPFNLPFQLPANPMLERLRGSQGVLSFENVHAEPELEPLQDLLAEIGCASLLVLPMLAGGNLHGLVMVHSVLPYRFFPEEIELARIICNQAAVAIQNARLYAETERLFAETQQRSAELSTLFDLGVSLTQVRDEDRVLEVIFSSVSRQIRCDAVVVTLLSEDGYLTAHIMEKGNRLEPVVAVQKGLSFSEYVIQMGQPVLIPDTQDNDHLPVAGVSVGDPCRTWLGTPITIRGAPVGVISVQSYSPNAYGLSETRLLEQVANQLSVSMDNARLFSTVQSYAQDLEKRVSERTEELRKEHTRSQTLLTIITELSASLDLDMVLNRTLNVVNQAIDAEHSLILMIEPDGSGLFLRASIGYSMPLPRGGQPALIKANEGLAGWVIQNRQPVLVDDLWQDPRWLRRKDRTQTYRSAIGVPLMVAEDILGVLMLFHRKEGRFTSDQLELILATARQIAVGINNAQLYILIRDQAERLGDMLRIQHIETSRSQAILESVADGVLVTDYRRQVTLFNMSAERILGLRQADVLGHSVDHFIGLFGKTGQSWLDTIRAWSEDPLSYKPGEAYSEQIELENRRVVAVSMSPVRLRNEFMGTVSIFRDITHEVEVDRLKSEFVATVSHELRTPMTSIKGYVELILMGATGELTEQQTRFLEIVKSATDHLSSLVSDLLNVSTIESGKLTLSLGSLEMRGVIEEVMDTFRRRAAQEKKSMEFSSDIPTRLPKVKGDPERVHQILDNLVENAFLYTPAGGHIQVLLRQVDDLVQVDVKDDGVGISTEEGDRIFERFYRGEDPMVLATSGTGLGLSIVKTLVEMHGGRIWFESAGVPGLGSTFSFTLPVSPPEEGGSNAKA